MFPALSAGPYPNSALPAGQLAIIAAIPALCLTIWLISVFLAARKPRHRASAAGTAALPQQPQRTEEPDRKAA